MHEMLNDSPVYQEMTRMAREEWLEAGFQQGLRQGLQQGQLQTLRQMIAEVVSERFPELVRLAQGKAAGASEPFPLRRAALKLSTVTTAEESRLALL